MDTDFLEKRVSTVVRNPFRLRPFSNLRSSVFICGFPFCSEFNRRIQVEILSLFLIAQRDEGPYTNEPFLVSSPLEKYAGQWNVTDES
jgi:hypothetical protein